jgi:hypothetical protein
MNTRALRISYGSPVATRRWHDIELVKPDGDRTEAMNQPGGIVLLRTTLRDTEWSGEDSFCSTSVAASLICIKGMMVAKRWLPGVIEPWVDEEDQRHHPGMILVDEEFALVPVSEVSGESGLLKPDSYIQGPDGYTKHSEFRWFDADSFMPRPTEEQVRACVENLPPPSEVESLRAELDKMRERYLDAEQRVSEARGAIEDGEEPWIWSDDDSAKQIDGFGHMMVVRITGGHLRALLSKSTEQQATVADSTLEQLAVLEPRGWVVHQPASGIDHGLSTAHWQADKGDMTAIGPTPELLLRAIAMCSEDCPVVHIEPDGRVKCECEDDEGETHSPCCPLSRRHAKVTEYMQEIRQV